MQPLEDSFTDKIRDYVKDIAAKNVGYMVSFEKIKPGVVRKIVAMTMRLLNSIIRSVQRDLNSKRFQFRCLLIPVLIYKIKAILSLMDLFYNL